MKTVIFAFFVLVAACSKSEPTEKAVVKISTAVCGECASTIRTAVHKVSGVKDVQVDTDAKTATVEFVPALASVADIEKAIVFSGYNANDKTRDPAAYDKLPDCCKK